MEQNRKQLLFRAVIGGIFGLFVMFSGILLGNSISILGSIPDYSSLVLVSHGAQEFFGSYPLAVLAQSVLCFALGAMVGISTMPFAEDGRALVVNSLTHFVGTGVIYSLLLVLCLDIFPGDLPVWLGILLALYLVIWLGRYVGWYVEMCQIREKLGLNGGPSTLKWRETLPYFPFLLLLCVGLPLLARLCDPRDVPVFSGILVPYLILPLGVFFSGVSLGKRQGFCPLYPVLAFVLYLPMAFLLFDSSAVFHCCLAAGMALAGSGIGAVIRRRK